MFNDDFSKIVYCYGSTWQPIFDDMLKTKPDIIFKVGVPSVGELETFTADQTHTCLVLDDLMCEINSTSGVEKIWTVHSHHLRMTVIFLTHNLFPKSTGSPVDKLEHELISFCSKTTETLCRYSISHVRCIPIRANFS